MDGLARIASGGNGEVAFLDVTELLGGLDCLDNGAVDGALRDGGQVRINAPVHDHLLNGPLVTGERADGHVRTEVGDQARGAAGGGGDGDALGAHDGGHVHSGHTHDVVDDAGAVRVLGGLELRVDGKVLLGLVRDVGLHLDGLDRVLAGSGLAGEHDGVGAVIDGVRDVGDLGAGRARVVLHGVEHLGRGDDGLVGRVALGDDLLLDVRHELGSDLDSQVAAGDHDAVGGLEDGVEVLDAQRALDLGEDRDVLATVQAAEVTDLLDGLGVADEGGGDVVDVLLDAEQDVLAVTVGDGGQADLDVGDVDALALADLAGVLDDAVHVLAVDGLDLEGDQAVIDQDEGAGLGLGGEVQVVKGDVGLVAEPVLGGGLRGHDDLVALVNGDLGVILEQAGADLRTLGVEQDAHGDAELAGDAADALDALVMLLIGAVREVEAGDVHARLDHLAEGLVAVAGRTHGAYDLRALVHSDLHLTVRVR